MNSLERQRRLTKLLAMVQTTRVAVWALSDRVRPDNESPIIVELNGSDIRLQQAAELLASAIERETVES
jgi:hypothetical protein